MRLDPRTQGYVAKKIAEGHSKPEIIRCQEGIRGSAYTAEKFTALGRRLEIRQSMGRAGSGVDNAAAEGFFSSLEWEGLPRPQFATTAAAPATVIEWCYGLSNHPRRHSAAAGLAPINYETAALTRDAA